MKKILFQALLTALLLAVSSTTRGEEAAKSILFVCEHGAAKSMLAASLFNQLAAEQKLDYRAIARGTKPDEVIPPAITNNLKKDGMEPPSVKPQALEKKDADRAAAIVAFTEIPTEMADPARVSSWTDLELPSIAADYEKAKAVMLPRIEAMVAKLKAK